jgi:putative lysine transport system substrate-binding protein
MLKRKEVKSMRIKKSKILAMALAGVMTLAALTGCGSSSSDDSASSDNVLRVGMECAYAPFNWTQDTTELANGEEAVPIYGTNTYAYGYDVMVAKKLADELGMELEVHKVEWDSIGMSLDAGEYDCIIAGMGRTAEREASYSFTDPYYYRDNCLVVKAGGDLDDVKGLSDLAGKNVTVTTQLGTGWVNLLDQIPDVTLGANYETTSECFMAITNGVADVCVIDVPTAESAAMTNSDLKIIYLDSSDKFEGDEEMTNVCIATRKDDTELRDKLQEAMTNIGWNDKTVMDETMETAISLQPAAN